MRDPVVEFFFFKQKTAYEITYGDWSSDVCSSDLGDRAELPFLHLLQRGAPRARDPVTRDRLAGPAGEGRGRALARGAARPPRELLLGRRRPRALAPARRREPPHRRGGRVETGSGGTDDRVGGAEREVVHDHANHRAAASRERRYMRVASAGRFRRSSTIPRRWSARALRGSSSTARS